jgi:hypothetical protein
MALNKSQVGSLVYHSLYNIFGIVTSLSKHNNDVTYVHWENPDYYFMYCVWNGNLIFSEDTSEQSKLAIRLKYGNI